MLTSKKYIYYPRQNSVKVSSLSSVRCKTLWGFISKHRTEAWMNYLPSAETVLHSTFLLAPVMHAQLIFTFTASVRLRGCFLLDLQMTFFSDIWDLLLSSAPLVGSCSSAAFYLTNQLNQTTILFLACLNILLKTATC